MSSLFRVQSLGVRFDFKRDQSDFKTVQIGMKMAYFIIKWPLKANKLRYVTSDQTDSSTEGVSLLVAFDRFLAKSEVRELHMTTCIKKNVFRLEISIDDT